MTSQLNHRDPQLDVDGEPGLKFDNSGKRNLLVPGFGHPVPIELPSADRFAHGFQDWAQNRLTAREIAMLRLMNDITDRSMWYVEVYDPAMVGRWAEQALQTHLISSASWNWCLEELRDKAEYHRKTGLTHVFDSSSRVCKSDELISAALLESLSSEVEDLALCEGGGLVSPDIFPLVYGKTCVLSGGGNVVRFNAVNLAGQGETSREQIWKCPRNASVNCDGTSRRGGFNGRSRGRGGSLRGGRGNPNCTRCGRTPNHRERSWEQHGGRFSSRHQWLPCEVAFRFYDAPQDHTKVKITSYINNLHPQRYASLYESIEKCIEASIGPWNEVLVYRDRARTPERIRTHGVQWTQPPSPPVSLEDINSTIDQGHGKLYDETEQWLKQYLEQPDNPRAPCPSRRYPLVEADWRKRFKPSEAVIAKYNRVQEWLHPEPGVAFTYEDWKKGENIHAVVDVYRQVGRQKSVNVSSKENHEFYSVSIEKQFAETGLQVVVEIGSVELTPEEPIQAASDWQLSGLLNDHIVSTTIIYFSTENFTPESGSLSFRVEAHLNPFLHVYGTNTGSNPFHPLDPLADIYGCDSHLDLSGDEDSEAPGGPALQVLGTVIAPDGRKIAFPNVMQHRVEGFALRDPTRPGRRRWLKLHLVDPHYRVCSTRNVPPQQFDWWYEAGMGKIDWAAHEVPAELVAEIETLAGEFPITREGAKQTGEEIKKERTKKFEMMNENVPLYCFGDWAADGDSKRWRIG